MDKIFNPETSHKLKNKNVDMVTLIYFSFNNLGLLKIFNPSGIETDTSSKEGIKLHSTFTPQSFRKLFIYCKRFL
jgi:hypothetical protein